MTIIKNTWVTEINFDAAAAYMDEDLREQVNMELAPCEQQEFFDRYCELHVAKYGDDFVWNLENPVA